MKNILTQCLGYSKMKKTQDTYRKYSEPFYQTFGVQLKRYWDKYLGFNINVFDKEFIDSGDRTMKDVIDAKYGNDAVTLIKNIIHQTVE